MYPSIEEIRQKLIEYNNNKRANLKNEKIALQAELHSRKVLTKEEKKALCDHINYKLDQYWLSQIKPHMPLHYKRTILNILKGYGLNKEHHVQ